MPNLNHQRNHPDEDGFVDKKREFGRSKRQVEENQSDGNAVEPSLRMDLSRLRPSC